MSKLQETIALSTTEAKYIASSHACKDTIWLKGILREIGRLQKNVPIFCVGESAIHLATIHVYHSKNKHIDVKYHFVRQSIGEGGVDMKKVHAQETCASMFTKLVLLENL